MSHSPIITISVTTTEGSPALTVSPSGTSVSFDGDDDPVITCKTDSSAAGWDVHVAGTSVTTSDTVVVITPDLTAPVTGSSGDTVLSQTITLSNVVVMTSGRNAEPARVHSNCDSQAVVVNQWTETITADSQDSQGNSLQSVDVPAGDYAPITTAESGSLDIQQSRGRPKVTISVPDCDT